MAVGLPIMASDTRLIPEVLVGTGVVVEGEPAAFTRAFAELAGDAAKRSELCAAACRRAQSIDGGRMEEREARLYQAIMQGRHDELDLMLSADGRFVN